MILMEPRINDSLPQIEQLGALSARLAHLLANHLSIITGNLHLAARIADPAKADAAIRAAAQAGDEAAAALAQFVDYRRALPGIEPSSPWASISPRLQEWVAARPGWRLEAKLDTSGPLAISLPWRWLAFVLDAIVTEARASSGSLRLHLPRQSERSSAHTRADLLSGHVIEIILACSSDNPLDWDAARFRLKPWSLAVAFELLSQVGAVPMSRSVSPTLQETRLRFPLRPQPLTPPSPG